MIEALIMLIIYVLILGVLAWVLIWCVDNFFPGFGRPARMIIGVIVLVVILLLLLNLLGGIGPGLDFGFSRVD